MFFPKYCDFRDGLKFFPFILWTRFFYCDLDSLGLVSVTIFVSIQHREDGFLIPPFLPKKQFCIFLYRGLASWYLIFSILDITQHSSLATLAPSAVFLPEDNAALLGLRPRRAFDKKVGLRGACQRPDIYNILHIIDLRQKLCYSVSTLNRIKNDIPDHLHKDLYYTLFESHLSLYCISVFGGINRSKLDAIHKMQKKVIRILFGDLEAYKEKCRTCTRSRKIGPW